MPVKGARRLAWDCPRKPWTVAGMGSGLSMRARAGDHWEGAPGRCAKASRKDKWADASAGSARWRAGAGSGSQVLLQLLEGPPAGAGQRALSTRRITSAPGAAVDAIPPPRAGHGASRAARSSPATARCGGPGTRGIRSRPLAPPREERPGHTREATMRCAAAPCYRHGRRRRARGPGPPVGAQVNIKLNSPGPHPQAHRMGRRQGQQAQAPAGRPPHPLDRLPAADALTDGRPEGRIDRLPQPAQSGRRPRPRRRRLRPAGVGRTRRRVGPRAAGGRGVVRVGPLGRPGAGRVQICCKGAPRPDRPRIKARNINDSLPALRRDRGLCNRFGQPTLR